MDKTIKAWWIRHKPSTRRLIQLYSALLHNAHLRGFIEGEIYQGKAKYACVPGLNCYSCPGAVGACPLGALQNAFAAAGHRAGWYMLGILLLFGTILGRTICGFLCPLGFLQELLHKIPSFKLVKGKITRALTYVKYGILVIFVVTIPLYAAFALDIPLPGFCKYICPAGTFGGAGGLLANPANAGMFGMLGVFFTRKVVILVLVCLACIFCYRSFCRFLCPLGAIYGLFNRFCLVGIRVDAGRCTGCGSCVRHCQMDVKLAGDHECIQCGECISACKEGAISLMAGGICLKAGEGKAEVGEKGKEREEKKAVEKRKEGTDWEENKEGKEREEKKEEKKLPARLLWGIALAVLAAALLWFNVFDPSLKTAQTTAESLSLKEEEDDIPEGYEVGMRLADFTISCLDGSEFSLSQTRGKVVFLNLWATYCTPCVKELPYFEALYQEHPSEVAVLAVHSSMVVDDPAEYLEGKEYTIPFAVDEGDEVWNIVNGSTVLPQTIVLNPEGVVIYNQKGSVTKEMLDALLAEAKEATGESLSAKEEGEDIPEGYEVGMRLADFTIPCLDGSEFSLAEMRGKVVFLNLWATYCTPCVKELPYFEALYQEHPSEVAVLAAHSSMVVDDPAEYLEGKDYTIPFAIDEGDEVWNIVNGSTVLPQTIVLNPEGVVIYNQKGSVTKEMLDALFAEALGE